jgi:RNA polymerase sigma factor (sigma-70 family)
MTIPALIGRAIQSATMTREEAARFVRGARAGDAEAWSELVAGYERLVLAIAFNFRLSRLDAEDVRQTVFLRLAQHLDRLRDPESVGSWIASVARNECLALLRRPAPGNIDEQHADPTVEGPEAGVLVAERNAEVWRAFDTISAECRALLTLLVLTDPSPSYEEVSAALELPMGSIGPTRRRCLDKLKDALGGAS